VSEEAREGERQEPAEHGKSVHPGAPRSPWVRRGFLLGALAVVVGVLVVAHEVLLPFVLALVVSYVLWPLVALVERRLRFGRPLAIVLVYVAVLGSLALFVRIVSPRIVAELGGLRRELPGLGLHVQEEWQKARERLRESGVSQAPSQVKEEPKEAAALVVKPRADGSMAVDVGQGFVVTPTRGGGFSVEPRYEPREESFDPNRILAEAVGKSFAYAERNALELAKIGRDIVAGVSRVVFVFGITLMLAAYIMLTREKIFAFLASMFRPSSQKSLDLLLWRVDRGLSGVVRGQLIICLVNGVLSAVGFAIVGLKYWPVLAIVCAVMSLIPIFGSIASAVPAVVLGLTQGVPVAVFVLAWIVGIHQLEANFLNPKIMGDAAKIHPVLVVFALLVGEHFFHTMGALLAVPCMSIAQSLFIHFRAVVEDGDPDFAHRPVPSMPPPAAPKAKSKG
jgi:predicted PurR-regulated permease PerM